MKKYELLTDQTITIGGRTLCRIRATRDFGDVKKGDIGGYVESKSNLSHYNNAWVYGDARVCDKAYVYGNAKIHGDAWVYNGAQVYGNAEVHNDVEIYGEAKVFGNAILFGAAKVFCNAKVHGNANVYGYAKVFGNAKVQGNAEVHGNAGVRGDAEVHGNADVHGLALINSDFDYIVFKNFWSSGRYFTWTRSNNMWSVGCFHGSGDELIKRAYADSPESGREYERVVRYVESILAQE